MLVWSLGQEDSLEWEIATHSSILAWKISWSEGPDGYSPWGSKESEMTEHTHTYSAAKLLQSCLTLCDPRDSSPPGSPVPGILQARTLEWVAISFSNAWKWKWSRSVVSDFSWPHGLQPTRLLRPWDFPGKSTGVGCHCLLCIHTLFLLKKEYLMEA